MLRLIFFLIILVGSVLLGIELIRHPGYLLIVYEPWMVQMPLWFALFCFILFCFVFYVLIDSIDRLQLLSYRIKTWFRFRREQRSFSKTQQGLISLIEARWKKAENLLLNGVNQSVEPLTNYLGAAKAAQELQAYERRDSYIQKAYQIAPNANIAIGITQAELELEQGLYEHAQATLVQLRHLSPRHPKILKLLEKVYVHLCDWQKLLELLPYLRKAKLITAQEYQTFEKNIYTEILRSAHLKTYEEITNLWLSMPKSVRQQPDVVAVYAKELFRFSVAYKELEELIRKTLNKNWQPELVQIYGALPLNNLNRQLVIVGAWLKIHGQKQELLWLLGNLCMRLQLWGKSKDYFEKCLAQGPLVDAALDYGKLMEQLGESADASKIYRDALQQLRFANEFSIKSPARYEDYPSAAI